MLTERGSTFGCRDLVVGMREMIPTLARAGVAAGTDGLFIEVHANPDKGPSDGPNMLKLSDLPALLRDVVAIRRALRLA
jgi:2-dehydro-3-deoxyphosphooctonate aldolase (KDO 8-P synthase)